eukprot:1195644-Prorocentrum_minimum.AAC.1
MPGACVRHGAYPGGLLKRVNHHRHHHIHEQELSEDDKRDQHRRRHELISTSAGAGAAVSGHTECCPLQVWAQGGSLT